MPGRRETGPALAGGGCWCPAHGSGPGREGFDSPAIHVPIIASRLNRETHVQSFERPSPGENRARRPSARRS